MLCFRLTESLSKLITFLHQHFAPAKASDATLTGVFSQMNHRRRLKLNQSIACYLLCFATQKKKS